MAAQLLLCVVLPPLLVQYCSQHSCEVAVKLFLHIYIYIYIYIYISYGVVQNFGIAFKSIFII